MCHKAILKNDETLESVPDCYKTQQMCDEDVDNYPDTLKSIPSYYLTQNMR